MATTAPHTPAEKGIALILALMALMLLSAIGLALALITSTEIAVASNYRDAQAVL
jgi:Tfp pilus assembly protein PilX